MKLNNKYKGIFYIILAAFGFAFMNLFVKPAGDLPALICLMAGLSATLGQFSITAAYTYAPAGELSVYDYSQIIFAALLGLISLGEVPDVMSIMGYVIICGAGIVMFLIRRKKEAS